MGPIGIPELLIILAIVVLLFGANKLPLIGKGMGEGIRLFKKGLHPDDDAHRLEERKEAKDRTG